MISRLVASVWCKPTRVAGAYCDDVSLFFEWRVLRWVALHIMASRGRSRNPVAFTFVSCVAACAVSFRAVSKGASVLCGCALAFLCCAPRAASRWQRDGVDSLYASPCGLLDCWDVAACARLLARARTQHTKHCARTCCSQRRCVFPSVCASVSSSKGWACWVCGGCVSYRSVGGAAGSFCVLLSFCVGSAWRGLGRLPG